MLSKIGGSDAFAFMLFVVLVWVASAAGYMLAGALGERIPRPVASVMAPGAHNDAVSQSVR
jgi:hypothetical protein